MNASDGTTPPAMTQVVEERLKALSSEFARELPLRLDELRALWTTLEAHTQGPNARDLLKRVHDIVHKFAGSAQHFGHPQLSLAAAPLDEFLVNRRKRQRPLANEETARIDGMIRDIEHAARASKDVGQQIG